jgi:dihydropyrimidinase
MRKIIQSGTLITAADTFKADILIEDEKIVQIGSQFDPTDAELVSADGKFVLPGGVDPHTHFDLPMFGTVSSDDHYTGHKAAAFGGTTTVIDFVSLDEATLQASVEVWRQKADPRACIDFSFHMNITRLNEAIAAEIPQLPLWGITSLKVFSAYNGRLRLQDGEIFQVMRIAGEHGLLTMLHAENGDVIDLLVSEALAKGHTEPIWHARTRPAWGAVEASLRGAALAAQAQAPLYIVHMNAGGEADQLKYARQEGLPIMGETCPQYLFFSEENLQREDGAKWVCSPPMRTAADNARLWKALADGTIQTIGTDHCPFYFDGSRPIMYEGREIAIPGKELGKDDFSKVPNGLPAVGDRLPILWTYGIGAGRISPNQFVELNCTNPAKIFGLYPQKGALVPGADADIVIWDPEKRVTYGVGTAQHRTDYNLFEGWELVGYPHKVYSRGRLIVDQGQWLGKAGQGRFIGREPGVQVI